jgi:hypothetical protein
MARYIDADKLLEQVNSLEQLARKRVSDTPTNSPAYTRYYTQWQERERILSIIKAQPTADVVPKKEIANVLCDLKHKIHDKAVRPNNAGIDAYISLKVFDAILQNYLKRLEEKNYEN